MRSIVAKPVVVMALVLAVAAVPLSVAAASPRFKPLSATFLDPYYDDRMHYSNAVDKSLTCDEWKAKMKDFYDMGIDTIILQEVHDAWGSYYPSDLPFMQPYLPGAACNDIVGAIMDGQAALPGGKVFLSCEYYENQYVNEGSNKTQMAGVQMIMAELVKKGYARHPAFAGWYFSEESYLQSPQQPVFPAELFGYLETLTTKAHSLTPGVDILISPYGTRNGQNTPQLVEQLKRLKRMGVSIVAYQDEVGCIRDQWPMQMALDGLIALGQAHEAANLTMWANIESFTWKNWPNNISSPLISPLIDRIVQQMVDAAAKVPQVERLITFSAQGMYERPDAPKPWGMQPGNFWLHEGYMAYRRFINGSAGVSAGGYITSREGLMAVSAMGQVKHAAIGAQVTSWSAMVAFSHPAKGTPYSHNFPQSLVDGLTGPPTTNGSEAHTKWLGYPCDPHATSAVSTISTTMTLPSDIKTFYAFAVRMLHVPTRWFTDGSGLHPHTHDTQSTLPTTVEFALLDAEGKTLEWWTAQREADPTYEPAHYDLYSPVYAVFEPSGRVVPGAASLSVLLKFPPSALLNASFAFIDEIMVNPTV